MKTKELIKLLQEVDPSGEKPVCVDGGIDIHFIELLPAYYDGCLEQLIRDPKASYYDIIGARIIMSGSKINIITLPIEDALYDNPDLPIQYETDEKREKMYRENFEYIREKARELIGQFIEKKSN